MRTLFIIALAALAAIAGTTNVRIYHQAVASPASVQNKQIGVNTTADANLGYKMWFGKDADGNVTQFLAKDKNARVLSLRQDSSFSLRDTSKLYKGDSAFIAGLKATRLYFDMLTGSKSTFDTSTVVKVLVLTKSNGTYTTSGMIWNDSLESAFENFTNGVRGTFNRCLFAQQQIILDSNSTTGKSLMGTDSSHGWWVGADSLPANWFKKGKRLRFGIAGIYSSKATSPGFDTIRIKLNDVVICSANVAMDANEINQNWRMDGAIICRDTGTSGSVACITAFNHTINTGVANSNPLYTLGTVVNTKIKQKFDLTSRFSVADVANKIRSIVFYLEEIH